MLTDSFAEKEAFNDHFLIISWHDYIIFDFIVGSAMKIAHTVYIQWKYEQKQVVYYSGKSIYRHSRGFLD